MCGIECAVDLRSKDVDAYDSDTYKLHLGKPEHHNEIQHIREAVRSMQADGESFYWEMNRDTRIRLENLDDNPLDVSPHAMSGIPILINAAGLDGTVWLKRRRVPLQPENKQGTPRGHLLKTADSLVNGDRNNQYGPPTQDFDRTANALTAMGYNGPGGRALVGHCWLCCLRL